ncbi:MAG: LytTR family DNA-binding domain-containing protein [Cyclobacteriaceae bacterium]
MAISAVIIDDEFLARKKVETLLSDFPFINLIGEAKNGEQAVQLIQMKSPELIFLDIEMPDFGGFDVIKKLGANELPYIIFTTAYDQYALRAFDVHAVDYLLKPLDSDRFKTAINLARERIEQNESASINKKVFDLLNQFEKKDSPYREAFEIKEKGREITVRTDEIFLLEANGNYIELETSERKYLHRSTMNSLADELNPKEFVRVHRSYLINTRYIKSCKYLTNNEYRFLLKNDREVISGRGYKENVQAYLDLEHH